MKQLCILILYFLFSVGIIYGQRTKELKLTFDKSDFLIDESDGQLSISSAKHPIQYGADTSEPGLPNVIVHVLIGGNEEYSGVRIQSTEMPLYSDVFVRNNPTYRVRGSKEAKEPVKRVTSYKRALYPEENVRYTGTHNVDGYKYITFLVSPFKYQPGLRKLDLLHDISLSIQLKPSKTRVQKAGRAMRDVVKRVVVNGDEMQALYETPRVNYRNTFSRDIRSGNDPFDYLIITVDSLKEQFQKLAEWKTRKGVPTKIITMEYIDSTFHGHTVGLPVKKAIKHYYDNNNIKYVLIGGDNNIIYSEKCQINYNEDTPSYKKNSVCDLFFACLNTPIDWDSNGNYFIAEYQDNVDCHPVVAVSRLSVASSTDAQKQIDRIINYERDPNILTWNDSILMMGCALDTLTLFGSLSDVAIKGQRISDSLNYFGSGGRFFFYDRRTSHPNDSLYNVSVSNFKEQMTKGYSFVHIDTHGGPDCLRLEPPEYFYNSDAADYTNPHCSMIVTSACSTNDFEADCLSEAFMRNPNGGIIAYWGGSNEVLGPQDDEYPDGYVVDERLLGPADRINVNVYRHLIKDYDNHLGDAVNMARLNYITAGDGNIPYNDPYRWTLFSMNLLGDPEMHIFKTRPHELEYRDLYFDESGTFNVNFTHETPTRICIMSIDDNGENTYEIIDFEINQYPGDGYAFDLSHDHDYSICFTRPGFKPYIINLYYTGTIQNDIIANDTVLWSDQAKVGYDVDSNKANGPVVIEKGDVFIKAPQGTTIKSHFTLKKGATLTIDPSISEFSDDPDIANN